MERQTAHADAQQSRGLGGICLPENAHHHDADSHSQADAGQCDAENLLCPAILLLRRFAAQLLDCRPQRFRQFGQRIDIRAG